MAQMGYNACSAGVSTRLLCCSNDLHCKQIPCCLLLYQSPAMLFTQALRIKLDLQVRLTAVYAPDSQLSRGQEQHNLWRRVHSRTRSQSTWACASSVQSAAR